MKGNERNMTETTVEENEKKWKELKVTWKEMKGKSMEMKWNEKETRLTKHIHDINFAKNMESDRAPPKER